MDASGCSIPTKVQDGCHHDTLQCRKSRPAKIRSRPRAAACPSICQATKTSRTSFVTCHPLNHYVKISKQLPFEARGHTWSVHKDTPQSHQNIRSYRHEDIHKEHRQKEFYEISCKAFRLLFMTSDNSNVHPFLVNPSKLALVCKEVGARKQNVECSRHGK